AYRLQLQHHPLRTKMLTAATLQACQEYLASYLTGMKNPEGGYFTDRVMKMSLYGFFVQAPLNHLLVSRLQKLFAGHTSIKAKASQILCSNLTILPIQTLALLVCQAVVRGASSLTLIKTSVKAGFVPMYRFSSVSSPLCMMFAQTFLPQDLWVPFFNAIAFCLGTTFNVIAKKKARAMTRTEEKKEDS
ncbi:Peroxisomal membrane protein, partial [Lachnellula willkommii]